MILNINLLFFIYQKIIFNDNDKKINKDMVLNINLLFIYLSKNH